MEHDLQPRQSGARPVPTPLFSLVNPVATQTPTENNTIIMREARKGVDKKEENIPDKC